MNALTLFIRTAQIFAVLTVLALFPVSVPAQEEGFTTLFPAGSGTADNPDDLTLGRISHAHGGGTFMTGATAIGSNAFALASGSTSLGSDSGPGVPLAGVTSLGANANFNDATGIFSTGIGAGSSSANGPNASGNYSIAIGGGDGVGGTGAVASGASGIAIGLSSVASGLSSTAIGGTGATTRPTIAAAGFSSAIGTGSQVANGATGALAAGDFNTVNAGGTFSTAVGNFNTVGGASATAVGAANTVNGANAVALGVNNTASGANSVAIGDAASASGTSSIAFGNSAGASGLNATAIGNGAKANFANSTALGNGAVVTRANQMVFGTGSNTYTAAGITSGASLAAQIGPTTFVTSDAAGDLATSAFGPSSFIALNNRINSVNDRVTNVRNEERGGVALAMATGQVRYDDQPGKISIGGGVGVFEDQGGAALGIGFTSPNARVRGNISGGGSFHGEFGGAAGLSITLN